MKKDIRNLKIRFVIAIAIIVTIILAIGFILICLSTSMVLNRMFIVGFIKQAIMRNIRIRVALICIISILIFTAIGFLLAKWIVRPVEASLKEQKQFVSDASHELKTPLTVITTNAEMLQSQDCSKEDIQKYSNNIITVSHQMRTLVEDLLNLARIEKGEEAGFTKFDLSMVCNEAILQYDAVMFELGLTLVGNITEGIKVYGSGQRLGQLLGILLDNAGKYSKPGTVSVNLFSQNKNAILIVENPADYISEDSLKKIFQRFYRLDEAHNDKGSFGLGLSIAQSICEAHKGKIHAEYLDRKIRFVVNIPLC